MASEEFTQVCNANDKFSKELYQILCKKVGNLLCSPFSAHTILSLLVQGASGETESLLIKALHLPAIQSLRQGYQQILHALELEKNMELLIANKIFIKEEYALHEEFDFISKKYFLSGIEHISFFPESAEAANKINDWVRNKTNNKIDSIINPNILDKDTLLVLLNAIYFNGQWKYPFHEGNTKKENFYISETEMKECNMMNRHGMLKYSDDLYLDAQILLMPYRNIKLQMLVILPKSNTGIKDLEVKLQCVNLRDLNIFSSSMREVILSLPKFRIEATIDMKQVLKEMGLGILFSCFCELSRITTSYEKINVSSVLQKSYVEVTEVGTEAACVTKVVAKRVVCKRMGRQEKPPPVIFNADHPFYFCIYYNYKEQILPIFSGKVERPSF